MKRSSGPEDDDGPAQKRQRSSSPENDDGPAQKRQRSSSPENDDGPAQKRLSDRERQILNERKQFCKQVDTSGKVIWSGTVEIADSQKIVFDCSIKAHPQDEGIESLFPLKHLTIRILPLSVLLSLRPYKLQLGSQLNLRTDENTGMMSYSAFSQAIRFGSSMAGCTVLENTPSALHLLVVQSFSYGREKYIVGNIKTCEVNENVLGILRSSGLLPCANLEHGLAKQNAVLKEELQNKDKMLNEQQRLILQLVEIHKKEMAEKEEELVRLNQEVEEQKKLAEEKQEELVKLHQEVEEQKMLAEKKQEELATSQNERDMMEKAISEKDEEIMVKDITMMKNDVALTRKDREMLLLQQKYFKLQNEKEKYEALRKEKTELEEELKCRVQMLDEEQKLHQEQKELVKKKEGEIVSLQGDMEERINLVEEQKMKLTEMEKKMEEMNTQIMEKDNALSVKDKEIMTLQLNQHKVEEMLEGALRMVRHSDAGRGGLHNINQSNNIEADTEQILMMETSRLELQNEVTMKQAALDEIGNMMENEFRCSICSELFIKTVTLNCSHSFCAFCIQKWQKDKRTCPNCRNIITASVRSVVLDSLIEKIIDKCGDEAKQRRNETVKERERDMQQEGQLCSIPTYVRHSDDETSTASSPASSLAHLSPSAPFMSPYNPPGTSYSMYSPYSYSPSQN